MELIIGIPLGILSSLVAWWLLFHIIVPKIEFSESISKLSVKNESAKSGQMYRIKIENKSRRSIIDVEVLVRFQIVGLSPKAPKNYQWETLKITPDRIPIIKKGGNRIFRLFPEKTTAFGEARYSSTIRDLLRAGTLTLEDILQINDKANIQMYVFGYDEFSGARKLFQSKLYTVKDIKHGRFEGPKIDCQENV